MSKSSPSTAVKLGLFISFNAMIVHEALATLGVKGVDSLSRAPGRESESIKVWLLTEWRHISEDIDYKPVFDLAIRTLEVCPSHPQLESTLRNLSNAAQSIVASRALLKHDISGRLYHRLLLRDVAKGLATYYTSIPAAYLLAELAVQSIETDMKFGQDARAPIIADFACGSGTLLSAAYSAMQDRLISESLANGAKLTENDFGKYHKAMLEDSLYGFDVLDYASHLAASWLTLRMPEAEVKKMNIFTLPLGGKTDPWLGSLNIRVLEDKLSIPRARGLSGEERGAEVTDVTRKAGVSVEMPRPDLVVMNPPFGRSGNVGKSIFLGHLPPEERAATIEKFKEHLKVMGTELKGSTGNAGLAPPFVWLGGRAVRDGGVVAFVLPRVVMSGVQWEPIRRYLASRFGIEHVIVCYDPSHSWAWSENTQLSEALLIARKGRSSPRTRVTYVYNRPRSALESKVLANRLLSIDAPASQDRFGKEEEVAFGGHHMATTFTLGADLLKVTNNWNLCMGYASSTLNREAFNITMNSMLFGEELPVAQLKEIVAICSVKRSKKTSLEPAIGFDVSPFQRAKDPHGPFSCDFIEGANVSTLNRLEVKPMSTIRLRKESKHYLDRKSHLLIAGIGRFWLYTIGLVSVCSTRPVLSDSLWTVRLREKVGSNHGYPVDGYRAQVLWLNSTPGIVAFLGMRQDSKGAFVQLKKEYLSNIPLLDYTALGKSAKAELAELYESIRHEDVLSLPAQLKDARRGKGFRHELDSKLLPAICPKLDLDMLPGLYERLLKETVISPNG